MKADDGMKGFKTLRQKFRDRKAKSGLLIDQVKRDLGELEQEQVELKKKIGKLKEENKRLQRETDPSDWASNKLIKDLRQVGQEQYEAKNVPT